MAPRNRTAQPEAAQSEATPPPFYEATDRIFWENPEAGVMPVLAHVPGDQVRPEDVEANGWHDKVKVPDEFAAPEPASAKLDPAAETETAVQYTTTADDSAGKE